MSFVPGASPQQVAEFERAMKRPEGTIMLGRSMFPGLHDESRPDGRLLEVTAGGHVFRLAREDGAAFLRGYHGSPGTDTRVASIPLSSLAPDETMDIWLAWSPEVLRLMVVRPSAPGEVTSADGEPSERKLWVALDGYVIEVGGPGVNTMGATVFSGVERLVGPPALDLWRETLEAIDILLTGQSEAGYIFEVVTANAGLGMLATGFETYCQERFIEIEREGISPDLSRLLQRFGSQSQRQAPADAVDDLLEAVASPLAALMQIASQINFQSFDQCKRAYSRAYAIRFGGLGLSSQALERVRRLLTYRHRVVHVSPMIAMLNLPEVPPEDPEFSGRPLVEGARGDLDAFIAALHESTIRLRP